MKLTIEELDLIEKYSTDELKKEEKEFLEQIPNWEEIAIFQEDFLEAIPVSKLEDIKGSLMLFEEEFQYAQNIQIKENELSIFDKIKQQIDLTLDEIAALFQPAPNYQLNLARVSRRGNLKVGEFDLKKEENKLFFTLTKQPTHSLQLTVENNLEEVLIKKEFSKEVGQNFYTELNELQNIPGRYYWRLVMDGEVVMNEFFIGKDLMKKVG